MAIRVLARSRLPLILSDFPQILSHPLQKTRSFSKPPSPPLKTPPESTGNPRFKRQVALAGLLQRYGFPSSSIHQFITKNPFLLDSTPSDVESCIKTLLSFNLSQHSLVSLLSSHPKALDRNHLQRLQLCFDELGQSDISPLTVLERLGKLRFEPDDIRRNILAMKNSGLSGCAVARVFEALPAAFMRDPIDVGRRVEFLKRAAGFKNGEIDRICCKYPEFLAFGVENRLRPLFDEMKELGLSQFEVKKVVLGNPRLVLGMEVGEISRCTALVKSLKCREAIKGRIQGNGVLGSAIDVKLRVDCLCRHGLIRRDAFKVLFVEPRAILYDLDDIEKKIDFLVREIGFGIECLTEFPEYLGVNLEKQIVPRHNVVQWLRSKGGLGFEVGLKHLVKLSRLRFYNLLVKPYPECEKIFGGLVREAEVKPRHPSGLWKVFKPQKFQDTAEDVKNMKLFMDSIV